MGANTKIEWSHHTFNPWEGCARVSAGCRFCYAERRDQQYHEGAHWGPNSTRKMMSESYWKQPLKWNREAAQAGERRRVFCASLADVFEDRPELIEPRYRLFSLINNTPDLDWLLLTKRPENINRIFADIKIHFGWPDDLSVMNVWLGTSVENQEQADKRIPELLKVPAAVRFLSCEPLLEPVDLVNLTRKMKVGEHCYNALACDVDPEDDDEFEGRCINWVIVGGESGPNFRPFDLDWARSLQQQCEAAGVAFHFKQHGGRTPDAGGCLLDGKEYKAYPKAA